MTDNTIINNTIYRIKTKIYKKYKTKYIRLSRNQLRIFESLYNDGGIN